MTKTTSLLVAFLAMAASAGRPVIKIWAGEENAFFLREDSTVYGIGRNDWSQLGRIHTDGVKSRNSGLNRFGKMFQDPEFPIGPNLYGAVSIVPAPTFTLAVLNDHTVWATGENSWGQHANGIIQPSPAFTQVLEGMDSVAAGDQHALYLGTDGVLKAAGRNHKGQLGLPADGLRRSALVTVTSGVRAVWAVGNTSFFVKSDGSVWAMGENVSGLISGSSAPVAATPVRIAGIPSSVVGVRASRKHAVALLADGTVWGWGSDENGALSGVRRPGSSIPRVIASTISDVTARTWGTILLHADGDISGIYGGVRGDIARNKGFGPSLGSIEIGRINLVDQQNERLRAFGCGEANCHWVQSSPTLYTSRFNWMAGVWETDGAPIVGSQDLLVGPGRKKIGSNTVSGADTYWKKGILRTSFPGERSFHFAPNFKGSFIELQHQNNSVLADIPWESGGEFVHVFRQKGENEIVGQGLRFLPQSVYLPGGPIQGCEQDAQGYNLCGNPIQAALDHSVLGENWGAVVVWTDPAPDSRHQIILPNKRVLISQLPTTESKPKIKLMGANTSYAIVNGFDLDLGVDQNYFGVTLQDCMLTGENIAYTGGSGEAVASIAGCVIMPKNTSAWLFKEVFGSTIFDSKVVGSGQGSGGFSQIIFGGSRFYSIVGIDINAFAGKISSTGSNLWRTIEHSAFRFSESGSSVFQYDSRFGPLDRVYSIGSLFLSSEDALNSESIGLPYFGDITEAGLFGLTVSGGGSLGAITRMVRLSQVSISSANSGGESPLIDVRDFHTDFRNVVLANSRSRSSRLVSNFGNISNGLIYANEFEGNELFSALLALSEFKSIRFLFNRELSTGDHSDGGEFQKPAKGILIDGPSGNGECTYETVYALYQNSTILRPHCGGSVKLRFAGNTLADNSLLIGNYEGSLNSSIRDINGSESAYLMDVDGPDDVRETWWDNDYSPKPGTAMIDRGGVNTVGEFDLAGYPRVSGAAIDIGAYELTDLATYTLQILPSEGGQTLPAEFAIAMPENGHKVQVVASPFNMWNFERWEFDPLDVSVENPLSPMTMVTLTKNASIKPIFRKTQTYDDIVRKYIDPTLDDWNPSCEFSGAPHWDFNHGSAFHFGDNRLQLVLEATAFRDQLATDGGVRVYLDVQEQPGLNVYDYRFKIRAKRGGGWFVTRERWDVSGSKPKWKFDGDSRVDATVGAVAPNTSLQTSLDGPFTKGTYVQPGGLFEIAVGLPQSVAKTDVGLWIEGAGDRFVTAATPLSYTWAGPGVSFTIDGNLQDWLAPVPGAAP